MTVDDLRRAEDRLLVLETRYQERDQQLQASLNDIRNELIKIAQGGMAICATHGQSIGNCESALNDVERQIEVLRRDTSESVRRIWVQLWAWVSLVLAAGVGAVIAHLTGAL